MFECRFVSPNPSFDHFSGTAVHLNLWTPTLRFLATQEVVGSTGPDTGRGCACIHESVVYSSGCVGMHRMWLVILVGPPASRTREDRSDTMKIVTKWTLGQAQGTTLGV